MLGKRATRYTGEWQRSTLVIITQVNDNAQCPPFFLDGSTSLYPEAKMRNFAFFHLPQGETRRGERVVNGSEPKRDPTELTAVLPAVPKPLQQAVFVRVPERHGSGGKGSVFENRMDRGFRELFYTKHTDAPARMHYGRNQNVA